MLNATTNQGDKMSQGMTNHLRRNHADRLSARHHRGRHGLQGAHRLHSTEETTTDSGMRVMISKFDGRCKCCGADMPKGTRILWSRDSGATHADRKLCNFIHSGRSEDEGPKG